MRTNTSIISLSLNLGRPAQDRSLGSRTSNRIPAPDGNVGADTEISLRNTLILGIGNLLLGDEGVGVHAARALLEEGGLSPGTSVLEVGTAILDALPALEKADRVIVLDAMKADGEPGTVYRELFRECRRPTTIASMHGFDLSRILALAGRNDSPDILVLGVEPAYLGWSLKLSPPVEAAMPGLLEAVRKEG